MAAPAPERWQLPTHSGGLVLLLLLQLGLLGWAATRHSPTIDEVGHLAAGLHHWRTGTFDLYCVNPPLVRLVATAPLALAGVELPDDVRFDREGSARSEFLLGKAFAARHGPRVFWYFTAARWTCLPFALLVTATIYLWTRQLYGQKGATIAATLWVVCPLALANGEQITPDTGATAFGLAACYLFWRWLVRPSWGRSVLAGFALGLALLCKFTCLLFVPVLLICWVARRYGRPDPQVGWRAQVLQLGAALFVAFYLLNAGYGFEGFGTRLGQFSWVSNAFTKEDASGRRSNRFENTILAGAPAPLPRNFLVGIDVQKRDFEVGYRSYFRGEWCQGGWWDYYLFGLLVKTPVGTLLIIGLACLSGFGLRRPRPEFRDEFALILPALAILVFVSSQTGFSHHLRYVLPGWPFAFVWAGRVATYAGCWKQSWYGIVGLAVVATVASSLAVYPHSMSYFNEPSGGSERGGDHFIDSNLDWGQDLLHLKTWYDAHPEARPFHLAYYGHVDPRVAGIEFAPPPSRDGSGPQPGWFAVSVTLLRGNRFRIADGAGGGVSVEASDYIYFQLCRPIARAGYSINIYHLGAEECERLREVLGLTPLVPRD